MHSSIKAAQTLQISLSTFQKYVTALEGAGFCFEEEKGARRFTEQDLQTMRLMIRTAEEKELSPGKAAYEIGPGACLSLLEKRLLLLEQRQHQLEQQLAKLSLPATVYTLPSYDPPPFLLLPRRRKRKVLTVFLTKKEEFSHFCRSKSRLLLKKGDSP